MKDLLKNKDQIEHYNYQFVPISRKLLSVVEQSKNLILVQDILTYTKEYPFYHNSMNMVQPIVQAVKEELPQVFQYLYSRIVPSNLIEKVLQPPIMENCRQNIPEWGDYGVVTVDDLTYARETERQLF